MTQTTCPKCSGTGYVAAFAHVKDGLCFDCAGTGTLAGVVATVAPKLGTPGITGLQAARIVGDAVLVDPTSVGRGIVAAALATFEDRGPTGWREADYGRARALRAVIEA